MGNKGRVYTSGNTFTYPNKYINRQQPSKSWSSSYTWPSAVGIIECPLCEQPIRVVIGDAVILNGDSEAGCTHVSKRVFGKRFFDFFKTLDRFEKAMVLKFYEEFPIGALVSLFNEERKHRFRDYNIVTIWANNHPKKKEVETEIMLNSM